MDKRRHVRVPFAGKARLSTEDIEPTSVTISNMSLAGLLFHTSQAFDLGKMITIQITGTFNEKTFKERVVGNIVAIHRGPAGNSFGIRFLTFLCEEKEPSLFGWVDSHEGKPIPSFLRNSIGAVE